jgi:hypothetical protein
VNSPARLAALEAATRLLLGWVERVLLPSYSNRKPVPDNLRGAIAAVRAALEEPAP